jgi:hypothetical protein
MPIAGAYLLLVKNHLNPRPTVKAASALGVLAALALITTVSGGVGSAAPPTTVPPAGTQPAATTQAPSTTTAPATTQPPATTLPSTTTPPTWTTVPCPITLGDEAYSTARNTRLSVPASSGLFANDNTCGEDVHVWEGTINGDLTVHPDGSFDYTPNPGFTGTDSFLYYVGDTYQGPEAAGSVVITVTGESAPCSIRLASDSYRVRAGTSLTVHPASGLLANDNACGEGVHVWESAREGELVVNPDGSFVYTPARGFTGEDSFVYYVGDAYPGPGDGSTSARIEVVAAPTSGATLPATR